MNKMSNQRLFKISLIIISTLFFYNLSSKASAQEIIWMEDLWLTTEFSMHPAAAVYENYVHLVWEDYRDSNHEIYYRNSENNGLTWKGNIRLTNNQAQSSLPDLAADQYAIHVVWGEGTGDNWDVYYKRSVDNGETWSDAYNLSKTENVSTRPSITVHENIVHIVWMEFIQSNDHRILYINSTDGGLTWDDVVELPIPSPNVWCPAITVKENTIHVVYRNRYGFSTPIGDKGDIIYTKSIDNGVTWSLPETLATTYTYGWETVWKTGLTASANNLYILWYNNVNQIDDSDIFYKMSSDNGRTWGNEIRIPDVNISINPTIEANSEKINIVWLEKTGYNPGAEESIKYILRTEGIS